ncbi:hypothetical protein IM538_04065 [Cytobacillus suaedae]|nr:hypothetical protein IM538_04065 [Cytobacillus suaedae]
MKKLIGLLGLLTVCALLFTRSLYVELDEWIIITVMLSIVAAITSTLYRKRGEVDAAKGSSAVICIVFFWILALFDLIADHFLYFQPTGNEDGRALTLGEKIHEFRDDLFIQFFITFFISFLFSIVLSKVLSKSSPKK